MMGSSDFTFHWLIFLIEYIFKIKFTNKFLFKQEKIAIKIDYKIPSLPSIITYFLCLSNTARNFY